VAIGQAIDEEIGNRRGQRTDLKSDEQGDLLGRGLVENFPQVETGQKTREVAAEKAGFGNEKTYRDAKSVVEHAEPELIDAMDREEIAISTAAKLATAPPETQRQAAADPKKAIELAKQASAAKVREITGNSKAIRAAASTERRAERIENIQEISKANASLDIGQTFPVLYADPPWRYDYAESDSRVIENQYPTMTVDEICALPVSDLATPDAVLFLWATSPKLAESMRVISAWGFEYRTCAVWDKEKIGMGYYFRQQHELLLVATRGNIPAPEPANRPPSVLSEPRGAHSAKPVMFAAAIEAMYPDLPRVELFCRAPRDGWSVWGNQSHGV